ncbi:hypothetical protein B5S43_08160 [Gilliamella apicola]|nr:hypothetical protein B5S43_08160 [Gilliamella apicola]OTQ24319.1 hypothetical protein B6D22_04005 [Gilliamella apicola]
MILLINICYLSFVTFVIIIESSFYSIIKWIYRDLVVRVAGYSAFFIALSPDTQDDIIAITGHVI